MPEGSRRSPHPLRASSPLPRKTVLMSSAATPKVSSAITGMPRATASIAAVELTVTSPSARVERARHRPRRDDEVRAGAPPSVAQELGVAVELGMGLVLALDGAQLHDDPPRRIRLRRRDEHPRHPQAIRPLQRHDRLRGEDEVGARRRDRMPRPGRGERQPRQREPLLEALSQGERRELPHLPLRVQDEQVALRAVQERLAASPGSRCRGAP